VPVAAMWFRKRLAAVCRPMLVPLTGAFLLWAPPTLSAQASDTTATPPAPVPLRGLIDADYLGGSPAARAGEEGFSLRRVRLIAQAPLAGGTLARVVVEPSALAIGSESAAPFRGVPLVEASIDYQPIPTLHLRGGQQRLPFGLAASTGAPSLLLPEHPLASRLLIQRVSVFRDIGAAAHVQSGRLQAGAGVFGGAGVNVRADNNRSRDLVGRASLTPVKGWTLSASGWRGRSGALHVVDGEPRRTFHDDSRFLRWGADARVVRQPFTVAMEYLWDRTEHNPRAVHPTPAGGTLRRHGWHAEAAARVLPALELAGRFDRWDPRLGTPGDEISELTGGISWYLHERLAPEHPRSGRAVNHVVRHIRLMLFAEHERSESAPSGTRYRLRWETFF
jgi:hypothetical protein